MSRPTPTEPAVDELREVVIDVAAHLAAAISLLERGGKKAAPSNRMFNQMLVDYRSSLNRARAALAAAPAPQPIEDADMKKCGECGSVRDRRGMDCLPDETWRCVDCVKAKAADREALVRLLQIITRNGSLDDGRTLHEVIADALLAAGWTRNREKK